MNKAIVYLVVLFCIFGAGCKKESNPITDSGNGDEITDEILPEDKNEFTVIFTSPDSGGYYYKANTINLVIESRDSFGTPLIMDSIKLSSNKDGIFFRWINEMGMLVSPGFGISLSTGEHVIKATVYSQGKIGFKKTVVTVLDTVYIKTAMENQHWTLFHISAENIYAMESDVEGNILIGTLEVGLLIRKNNQWISYTTENSSLLSNEIQCISVDHDNNIYIGHWTTGGFNKFNGSSWSTIGPHDSSQYAHTDIHSIAFDKNNKLWAALHDGTIHTHDGGWNKVSPESTWFGHPGKIMFDSQGNLWGNAEHNYSFKYDGATWQLFNTIPKNYDMIIDKNDIVWFGAWFNGLYRYDGTTFTNYSADNSALPTNNITSLAIDKDNNLWIGTMEGLVKYNGVEWTVFTTDNSDLPANHVHSVAVDGQNNVWVGMENNIAVYKK